MGFFFVVVVDSHVYFIVEQEYLVQGSIECLQGCGFVVGFQFAFPNDYCVPSKLAQLYSLLYVAFFVAIYFLFPKNGIAFWHNEISASFVAVPEAAVDEDGGAVFAQHNVRRAGQALDIYAVAVAPCVQVMAHNQLGLRVLALDACHALVPLFFCHPVCHAIKG